MHSAALAPIQPYISSTDKADPLFSQYMHYRSSMSNLHVEASSFVDWKAGYLANIKTDEMHNHPKYTEFKRWMWANQGGARKCPALNTFEYWLSGGRW